MDNFFSSSPFEYFVGTIAVSCILFFLLKTLKEDEIKKSNPLFLYTLGDKRFLYAYIVLCSLLVVLGIIGVFVAIVS